VTADAPIPGWAGARVLMLAPTPSWPLDQGNRRRIHAMGQAIRAAGAEVFFAHYPAEHDWRGAADARAHAAMAAQWDGYFVIPPTRPLHTPPEAGEDHTIDEWWDPAIGRFLDWFCARHRTDALIVHYPFLSRALLHAPRLALRVLDMHDRFAGRRQVLAQAGIAPEFFHTTEEQEAIALSRADVVLAIKREEAAAFRRATATPVLVLPHAEPQRDLAPAPDRGVLRFGLLGARNSVNLAATRAFLAALHERLRRTLLPCEIVLAGSVCDGIPADALPRYVRRLGRVADVAAFYAEADVVLAPLSVSTGLKIRVGEALAFGRPVLALEHAFEGYPVRHAFHALADMEALLDAMHRCVAEPALLPALTEASRAAAAELREQARAGLAALGARLSAMPRGVVMPLPAMDADARALLAAHAAAVAAGSGAPLVVLGDAAPVPDAVRVSETSRPAPAPGEGLARVATLPALLAARPIAAWFAAPVPLPEGRFDLPAVFAADVAAALAPPEDNAAFLDALRQRFARVLVVAGDPLPGAALRVPPLARPGRIEARRGEALWVLADDAECPLAALAARIAARVAPRRPLRVTGGEAAREVLAQPLPWLVVDCARAGPRFGLLRGLCAAHGVPVLRFGRGGARLLGRDAEGPVADALRLADMLCGAAPPPPPEDVPPDAGWAALRRVLGTA
jgi:glycosyltransferase involved in cell wall biosynthesis